MPFEKKIEFTPAYDKRPQYGVHGMEMRFLLKGPKGVIQFLLFTHWMTKNVQEEQEKKYKNIPMPSCLYEPFPADIGYHSYVPMYEGQGTMGPCPYLDNKPCFYDGSTLNADPIYWLLVEHGEEALWKRLEEEYESRFAEVTA